VKEITDKFERERKQNIKDGLIFEDE